MVLLALLMFVIPAHEARYKAFFPAQRNYLNTLHDVPVQIPGILEIHVTDTVTKIDTIMEIAKVQVLTYMPDSVKPIEPVEKHTADEIYIFSSADPTGTEKHNRELAKKRADYLRNFFTGAKIKVKIKTGIGRFSIIIFKTGGVGNAR